MSSLAVGTQSGITVDLLILRGNAKELSSPNPPSHFPYFRQSSGVFSRYPRVCLLYVRTRRGHFDTFRPNQATAKLKSGRVLQEAHKSSPTMVCAARMSETWMFSSFSSSNKAGRGVVFGDKLE